MLIIDQKPIKISNLEIKKLMKVVEDACIKATKYGLFELNKPWSKDQEPNHEDIIVLHPKAFDEFLDVMGNPGKPTESIVEAAELLKKLRKHKDVIDGS